MIGSDGRLKIQDNLLQVFDGATTPFERVALGDVNNDGSVYGLRIRGADGTTILFDENGQTKEGFTDGYNKLDDNSLDPKKIDIQKVVTRINEGTETIEASKILLDNNTLDVKFSSIETTINDHEQTISNHSSQITALDNAIQLKVDTQTYNTKMTSIDGAINLINTDLSKATSDISVLQGQIELKVEQTDIDQAINTVDTKIDNKVSEINLSLNSITQRVSSVESSVSTIDDEVTSLETRIQTAEQKITPTAIVSTVRQSTAYQNDLGEKVSKNNIISEINQTAETIKIQASKIKLEGLVTANSNFKILTDGSIEAKNADISGNITAKAELLVVGISIKVIAAP